MQLKLQLSNDYLNYTTSNASFGVIKGGNGNLSFEQRNCDVQLLILVFFELCKLKKITEYNQLGEGQSNNIIHYLKSFETRNNSVFIHFC